MCDTFLALASATADGSIIFGKNSDREPNEAQVLEYHPAAGFGESEQVACTYRTIPQIKQTYAVLLCRPFWMWGAEMGANEKGVVIGNEAVFTRMPLEKKGGLTGMDLLRLALERAADAAQALETIVGLLADFGQGGICGYEDRRMAYHNSFIIADAQQGWVLETAGPLWAAVKINKFYTISNALTIGEQFDECHPKLIETARRKGWLKKGRTFHFARCYSDWFYTTFSAARRRQRRSFDLIREKNGKLDAAAAVGILRDHGNGGYRPDSHLLGNRICAHAGNPLARNATQSTGSLVACLKPQRQTFLVTGTSAPCTAIFKPVWFGKDVLPDLGPTPDGTCNPAALWWFHENLHRLVLMDFENRLESFRRQRDELEKSWFDRAGRISEQQRWELTCSAFRQARDKTAAWIEQVRAMPLSRRNKAIYRRYWEKQNQKAGMLNLWKGDR